MSGARQGANGKLGPAAAILGSAGPSAAPALSLQPAGLMLPASAAQPSRYPFLEHFAARGQLAPGGKHMQAYQVRLGVRLGLGTGRDMTLTLSPGMPAAALAELLEKTAASLRAWVADCAAEGTDPRDKPQPAERAQDQPPQLCAACELVPHASCTRDACPQRAPGADTRGSGASQ